MNQTLDQKPKNVEELVRQEAKRKNRLGITPKAQNCIAVLTPTLGYASFWYFTGILGLIWPMNTGKGIIPCTDHVGNEIAEMRNRLVAMMLASDESSATKISHVMWVDDDVIIQPSAMLALVVHDRDIASGVYFSKNELSEPLIFEGPSSGTGVFKPGQTKESWGWSQGLSLVKLEVYRKIRDELDVGKDKYGNPMWYESQMDQAAKSGNLQSLGTEDFPFFDKCNLLGYRCLQDMGPHTFGFHYDLQSDQGYPKKQWEQFKRREPIVWPAKNGCDEEVWR